MSRKSSWTSPVSSRFCESENSFMLVRWLNVSSGRLPERSLWPRLSFSSEARRAPKVGRMSYSL